MPVVNDYQRDVDPDVWLEIASYLEPRDVARFARAGSYWCSLFSTQVAREVSDSFLKTLTTWEDSITGDTFVSLYYVSCPGIYVLMRIINSLRIFYGNPPLKIGTRL